MAHTLKLRKPAIKDIGEADGALLFFFIDTGTLQ